MSIKVAELNVMVDYIIYRARNFQCNKTNHNTDHNGGIDNNNISIYNSNTNLNDNNANGNRETLETPYLT